MTLQWIKNLLLLMLNLFPIIITLLNLFLLISFSLLSFNNSSYISFIIILILFSYIELSFLLSCIVKPCSLEDYQILPSYRINEISLTSCKNIILNQSNQKLRDIIFNNEIPQLPFCKKCKRYKAIRSHHCSICNKCIFKMDHHCIIINNCIGMNNHRYFLQFLFFAQIYVIYIMLYTLFYYDTQYLKYKVWRGTILLCLISCVILSVFNIWQWSFALQGKTTVEYWMMKDNYKASERIISDFGFSNWRDNLYMIFGTKSIVRALFIINFKKLDYNPLIWTKVVYRNNTNLVHLFNKKLID